MGKKCMTAAVTMGVFTLVTPAIAAETARTARAEALKEIPKWETYSAEDSGSLEETFFRLQNSFALPAETGSRALGSVPFWPRGSLKFGTVRILPYLRQAVSYESNHFRTNETPRRGTHPTASPRSHGRDGSVTHVNQIGAMADTLLDGGRLRLSGAIDSQWLLRYASESRHADDWDFDGQLGASYAINKDIRAGIGYRWERRSDPMETNASSRFRRTNQQAVANLSYANIGVRGLKARFGVTTRDVDASKSNETALNRHDRTEIEYKLRASYPVWSESTDLFVQGRYRTEERESDEINDGDVYGMDFGMSGAIPITRNEYGGLRGEVSFGFDSGSYENETYNRGSQVLIRDDSDDETNLSVRGRLQYIATPRTSWDMTVFRGQQFSLHGNYQIVNRLELNVTHNASCKLVSRIGVFWEHVDPSGLVSPKSALTGNTGLKNQQEYEDWDRFGVGVGARYPIEDWLDVDGSIGVERKNSYESRSFSNYSAQVGLTLYLAGLNTASMRRSLGY